MAGYTRQDTSNNISTGNVINASDLDNEFDALAASYSITTGHKHDGTTAEGPPITVVGPAQDIIVSSTGVTPKTTNVYDLGSSANKFKTAYIETATLTAGTVGGSAIVTLAGTQTLTNKTLNLTSNTLVATSAQLAAALTDETGTGSIVFSASPTLTGAPLAPTATAGTNTTQIATTAFVFAERSNSFTLTNKTLSAPTITGVSVAPTAAAGTNTTQIATTAHVFAERTNTATLTNKTLTSPTINSATITDATITGTYAGTFTTLANGTIALTFGTSPVLKVTPTATGFFSSSIPAAGTDCTLLIVTSGTTSYTMNFSALYFKTTGSLATGTTTAKTFVVKFISDGNYLYETSRTTAI